MYAPYATYACSANYAARPVNTARGGAYRLCGPEILHARRQANPKRLPRPFIRWAAASRATLSFCRTAWPPALTDEGLYAWSLGTQDVFLTASDVTWARVVDMGALAFATDGGTKLCCYGGGDRTALIAADDAARFIDMDTSYALATTAYIAQEKNGAHSIVSMVLSVVRGD